MAEGAERAPGAHAGGAGAGGDDTLMARFARNLRAEREEHERHLARLGALYEERIAMGQSVMGGTRGSAARWETQARWTHRELGDLEMRQRDVEILLRGELPAEVRARREELLALCRKEVADMRATYEAMPAWRPGVAWEERTE